MPCDTVRQTSVRLDKAQPALMMAALESLKLNPRLDANGHTIFFGDNERLDCQTGQGRFNSYRDQAEIKRAYSAAVVKATAKKFGWQPASSNTNEQFTFNKR